jgi:hypothetical protein
MKWVKHPVPDYEGDVFVNGTVYSFRSGVTQVKSIEDLQIFEEYVQCREIPDEVAKALNSEKETKTKPKSTKIAEKATPEKKG